MGGVEKFLDNYLPVGKVPIISTLYLQPSTLTRYATNVPITTYVNNLLNIFKQIIEMKQELS